MERIRCDEARAPVGFGLGRDSRIVIVGTSGSGKSELARRLSRALGVRDIELDALHWKPNWEESGDEEFREKIRVSVAGAGGFVIHGNYGRVRDLTWGACDTMIWLDYPRAVVMSRVIRRTLGRILSREELWNGNVETWKSSVFSRDSIILWAWSTYAKRRRQYGSLTDDDCYGIRRMITLRKPRDPRLLLRSIGRDLTRAGA